MSNSNVNSASASELLSALQSVIERQESRLAALRQQQDLQPFNTRKCSELLVAARKEQGISLENLSILSGVSTVTLGKLEKGQLNVNFETLLKVLDALGISLWIGR